MPGAFESTFLGQDSPDQECLCDKKSDVSIVYFVLPAELP